MEIELGDKVKCINTGFIGTATTKMEFMNGCIQYEVVPKVGKDNKMPEGVFIDAISLKIVKKKPKPRVKDDNGGPNHASIRMRGY